MAKVKHDRDGCIGCSACVMVCPKFWEMSDDGKSTLKGHTDNELEIGEEDVSCNKEAEASCPVNVIHVEE